MKGKLVVLSVPFQRLNRVLLTNPVLDVLEEAGDVVAITPFAQNADFINAHKRNGISFLTAPQEGISRFRNKLYWMSEMARLQGYWRKNKNKGLAYFLKNRNRQLGDEGADVNRPFLVRLSSAVFSFVGMWPGFWHLLDRCLGTAFFSFPELTALARQYNEVILVQSASWGFQDRLLAHAARRHNWETILIPYTTDQLYTNGYLMSDFKAICVQGPLEKDFAERFHSPAADRLIELGSAWFRNIDIIKNELPLLASGAGNRKRRIIYSGSTSEYFPTASEYKGLDTLLEAINQNTISNAVIVYRPFGHTPELRKAINERYSSIPNLVIEYAQGACYGLSAYASLSEKEELKEYILQIMDADLLVMCLASTLSLDAAYLGVPTIANHVDETGTLVKRHTDLLYEKEGGIRGVPDIPVAHSYEDLITGVQLLLNDRARAQDQCRKTSLQWDYPETDFQETLREIISKPISA